MWVGDREGIARTGMSPVAQLVDWEMAAMDFRKEGEGILMAPGRAIPRLLARHGLRFSDVALFEIHEAFAAQVLGNVKAASDPVFAVRRHMWPSISAPSIGAASIRTAARWRWAIRSPTVSRILSQAVKEMTSLPPNSFAIVSVCADGGQGTVALLRRASGHSEKPPISMIG